MSKQDELCEWINVYFGKGGIPIVDAALAEAREEGRREKEAEFTLLLKNEIARRRST